MECWTITWYGVEMRFSLESGGHNLFLYNTKIPVVCHSRCYDGEYFIRQAEPDYKEDIKGFVLDYSRSDEDKILVLWGVVTSVTEPEIYLGNCQVIGQETVSLKDEWRFHCLLVMEAGQTITASDGDRVIDIVAYKGDQVVIRQADYRHYTKELIIYDRKAIFAAYERESLERKGPCMDGWPAIP